jgi:hypothetical protein
MQALLQPPTADRTPVLDGDCTALEVQRLGVLEEVSAQSGSSSGRERTGCAQSAHMAAARAAAGDGAPGCETLRLLGLDVARRHSLVALDADTVAVPAGSGVLLLHLPTLGQRFLPSRDGGGVGAMAVHPQRRCFAVAEKCPKGAPNM